LLANDIVQASTFPILYKQHVYRLVETQEYAATLSIVDNLDEQSQLEALLDDIKPTYQENTENRHYLIKTPFRYPPLKHGSRFGNRALPSFFYASEDIATCLAESAYYRFVFFSDLFIPFEQAVTTEHSMFHVFVSSTNAVDLSKISDAEIQAVLTNKHDYSFTQQLGKTFTEQHNLSIIRFHSARANGFNVAIADINDIKSKQPLGLTQWICFTDGKKVSFNTRGTKPLNFDITEFLSENELPRPA
jgi:hypothetical protein